MSSCGIPGDGSDVVDGGTGTDTLRFNGANVGESFNIVACRRAARFAWIATSTTSSRSWTTSSGSNSRPSAATIPVLIDNLGATDSSSAGDRSVERNTRRRRWRGRHHRGRRQQRQQQHHPEPNRRHHLGDRPAARRSPLPPPRSAISSRSDAMTATIRSMPPDCRPPIRLGLDGGTGNDVVTGGAGNDFAERRRRQ